MKIGHLENKAALSPAVNERKGPSDTVPGTGAHEPSAKVELSATASMLATGSASGDFDAEKVERISQAIRDGKFVINAEAIADKLIVNARELMGPPRQ